MTVVGWWNGSGRSMRPRSVAIEAVRGDQAVIVEVSEATAPPRVAQAQRDVEVGAGLGERRGGRHVADGSPRNRWAKVSG